MVDLPKGRGAIEGFIPVKPNKEEKLNSISEKIFSGIPGPNVDTTQASKSTTEVAVHKILEEAGKYAAKQETLTDQKTIASTKKEINTKIQRETLKPTSVLLPPIAQKELSSMNFRLFDYNLHVTPKTLIMYALDMLRLKADDEIYRTLKQYDFDKRKKEFRNR